MCVLRKKSGQGGRPVHVLRKSRLKESVQRAAYEKNRVKEGVPCASYEKSRVKEGVSCTSYEKNQVKEGVQCASYEQNRVKEGVQRTSYEKIGSRRASGARPTNESGQGGRTARVLRTTQHMNCIAGRGTTVSSNARRFHLSRLWSVLWQGERSKMPLERSPCQRTDQSLDR